MKSRNIVISVLSGLFLACLAMAAAGAQYVPPSADQVLVNQPYAAGTSNIVPPAGFASPGMDAAYPLGATMAPYGACAAPVAAPCIAAAPVACGPFTSGFTYSATQSSAYGPFTPPVAQAAEQFYQYPGLTPYGPYPGAGYAAAGGVGFDPMSGYYGPYGAYTPLI